MPQLRLYMYIYIYWRDWQKLWEETRGTQIKVESISNRTFTRSDRKSKAAEMNKSAIIDHVAKENHVINWSGAKILEREGHRKTRQIKESIWIRKEPNCMNRDGGTYSLPTANDRLLVTCSTSRDHKPDEARRWRAKRHN